MLTLQRYLVAELWRGDEMLARWTSRIPGQTGPYDLQHAHAKDAPPMEQADGERDGWVYFWVET